MEDLNVNVSAHSLELGCTAKVVLNAKGEPETLILSGPHGTELRFPGFAYPFVKNGGTVLAVVTVVQVAKAEPKLAPSILRPGI